MRYVVRSGDTLSALASRFGTTVTDIAHENGIPDPNVIGTGPLWIPFTGVAPAALPPYGWAPVALQVRGSDLAAPGQALRRYPAATAIPRGWKSTDSGMCSL